MVLEVVNQIERMADAVVRSSEAMTALQEESDKIGSVMNVIRAVAEQTNLLALNAAIEAARAGGPVAASPWSPTRCAAGAAYAEVHRGNRRAGRRATERHPAGRRDHAYQRDLTDSGVELARRASASLGSITRTVSNIGR